MSQTGFGVMMHWLGGGSKNDPQKYVGRKIVSASLADNRCTINFEDGTSIAVWDDGQSCCERRYMTTDDDMQTLVGHKLVRIEGKAGPGTDAEYDVHETCFVEIGTDAGFVTLVTHNEHNGYYGGFGLTITEEK